MTDDKVEGFHYKVRQAHESYSKGMELLGIFSAGTIGFIVALRPETHGAKIFLLQVAVVCLFVTVLGTIAWFMGKGSQYMRTADQIRADQTGLIASKELWWVTTARVVGMASFLAAYVLLFFTL